MKKLKYMCFFHGSELPWVLCILGIILFPWAVGAAIGSDFRTDSIVTLGGSVAILVGVLFTCACEFRSLTDREQEVISHLPPPVWRPVTEGDMKVVSRYLERYRAYSGYTLLLTLMAGGMVVLAYLASEEGWELSRLLLWMLPVLGVPGGCIILHVGTLLHWKGITADAEYLEIQVSYCFARRQLMLFSEAKKPYLVFYLPDGKYVLECTPSNPEPEYVRIIRWKGRCIYIPHN